MPVLQLLVNYNNLSHLAPHRICEDDDFKVTYYFIWNMPACQTHSGVIYFMKHASKSYNQEFNSLR